MKEYSFHVEMYDAWVTCFIGGDVKELKKELREKHGGKLPAMWSWDKRFYFGKQGETTDGYQFHVNAPLGDGEVFYVWRASSEKLSWHEAYHIMGDIMFTRGVIYCYESEEAYAYLGDFIFNKINSLING